MQEDAARFFNLETPSPGASLSSGRQVLRGWLVPKRGTHLVDVRARAGSRLFPGVYGFPRPDLAAHFEPARPWLPAGFTIEVDLAPGRTEVQLEALDLTGHWEVFLPLTVQVEAAPAPPPEREPADPITATEFGRALRFGIGADALPHPRIIQPTRLPFHGYLVDPAAIAPAPYGRLDVVGWLFHETQPIVRVYASTDLLTLQPLRHGGEFAGVKERFSDLPHAADCRVSGFVDVSERLPSPACVRIYAELPDGSMHLCLALRCRAVGTEQLKAPARPASLLGFWRGWRGLRRALADRGTRVEAGAPLRREFWSLSGKFRKAARPRRMDGRPASSRIEPTGGTPVPLESNPRAGRRGHGLRLLLITHNLNLEGAPLLFVEYARHLVTALGAELTVLSGQDGPLRAAFAELGATITVIDGAALFAARSPREGERGLRAISAQIDWEGIDLVVANTLMSFWSVPLARIARRPSLLYIHESTRPAVFFQRTAPALLPVVHEAFQTATAVSFNTPATRAYYEDLGSGRNFHLHSAWIDVAAIDRFRNAHDRDRLRAGLGVRSGELLVANIGSVCERKGQHDFLRAVEWLWRCDPALAVRCRFVMVGGRDTPYNRDLEARLAALGRSNVHLVPETSHAYDYFGAADLFVCTSYEESFPRVVLEAMAFEVPVVSTRVHGVPYMLREPDEAILVAPGDVAALTSGMLAVLADPTRASARAARARARVAEFDAAVVLPRHAAFTARVAATPV